MSYFRVVPRDLFNEANLLKCYGQLYLNLEEIGKEDCLVHVECDQRFMVEMDNSSGVLTVLNIGLKLEGKKYFFYRPINSRRAWPFYLLNVDDGEIEVYDDFGNFTDEMMAFIKGETDD